MVIILKKKKESFISCMSRIQTWLQIHVICFNLTRSYNQRSTFILQGEATDCARFCLTALALSLSLSPLTRFTGRLHARAQGAYFRHGHFTRTRSETNPKNPVRVRTDPIKLLYRSCCRGSADLRPNPIQTRWIPELIM